MSVVADLAVLTETELTNNEDEEEHEITAPKIKKPRTKKQIEATLKMNDVRKKKSLERKELQHKQDEEIKKEMNDKADEIKDKIIRKAIAIKKRQIKKEAILDEIEDDDTPIEEIQKIVKQTRITARNQITPKVKSLDHDLRDVKTNQPPPPATPKALKFSFVE